MNIGQAASVSGVSAKLIRYYEQIGLVRPAARTGSNYRDFGPAQIGELTFIKRVRTLGFSIEEITELMDLWRDHERSASERRSMAARYIHELQARVTDIGALADSLRELAARFDGVADPDSPKRLVPPWTDEPL
jgi:MerR family gold-responsive transcriptional activator of gol and ges genes